MTMAENTDASVTPFPKRAKIRLDQDTLTFEELDAVEVELGMSLSQIFEVSQARGVAALAWVIIRRDKPEFTFEEAMKLRPADVDLVSNSDPEAQGASDGAPQQESPAPGA